MKTSPPSTKRTPIFNFPIDPRDHERLRAMKARYDRPMAAFVREALRDLFRKYSSPKNTSAA